MDIKHFSGVHTALVTPFKDGKVAYDDLERLVEQQIAEGINGIVAVGTTGESPTLDHAEHIAVVEHIVRTVKGRVPVTAGSGSNSTEEAVELTRRADAAGADALLVVSPYYNKPSQEGLFLHLSKVAEATRKPIVLYSIPGRCVIEFAVETVARLYEAHPHICAIKESGGSCDRVDQLVRTLGADYAVVSGDDSMTLPFMSVGARGVISVASNFVIADLVEMVRLANANDFAAARKLFQRHSQLMSDLFREPNPVPVKYLLHASGRISSPEVRLPLAPLSDELKPVLDRHLKNGGDR